MAGLNINLWVLLKAKSNTQARKIYKFDQETRTLVVIMIFFGLSYLFRFIWDKSQTAFEDVSSSFGFFSMFDTIVLLDGLSFIALLAFHRQNFCEQ